MSEAILHGDLDGTAREALHAKVADEVANMPDLGNVEHATHADSADNATHADTADNATHATSADTATNAVTAQTATNATTAKTATTTKTANNGGRSYRLRHYWLNDFINQGGDEK